jgi:hypothetical protein
MKKELVAVSIIDRGGCFISAIASRSTVMGSCQFICEAKTSGFTVGREQEFPHAEI